MTCEICKNSAATYCNNCMPMNKSNSEEKEIEWKKKLGDPYPYCDTKDDSQNEEECPNCGYDLTEYDPRDPYHHSYELCPVIHPFEKCPNPENWEENRKKYNSKK